MGFFNDVFKAATNPLSLATMPLAGGLGAAAIYAKNKRNNSIDNQMVNPGQAPQMLDPNDVGQPQAGGSAWARMQRQQNANQAQRALGGARQSAYGNLAAARSDLASRGGISSGASERLAQAGMNNAANLRQSAAGDLANANLGTNIEDERLRRNAYNQIRMQNQGMQGALYAGNQMSNATLNASRPQGLFGLGFMGL